MKIHHQNTGSLKSSSNSLRTNSLLFLTLLSCILSVQGKELDSPLNPGSLPQENQKELFETFRGEEQFSNMAEVIINTSAINNPKAFVLAEVGTRVIGMPETTCWIGWLPRKNSSAFNNWAKASVTLLKIPMGM